MSDGEAAQPTEDSAPSVCLCIPTFRRPQGLRKLLAHVAQLSYGGSFRIIVVENDAQGQAGAKIVEELARDYPFPLTCVVEPKRGHTFACNCAFTAACLDATPSTYIAMLDDDEYPEPNWLAELVGVALKYGAELVGGPVFPVFDAPEHWLVKTGVYAPTRFATGRVPMIYGSGNMMICRSTLKNTLMSRFQTISLSPAEAMKSSSGAAAEKAGRSHGPTTRMYSKRRRCPEPPSGTCCGEDFAPARVRRASNVNWQETSAAHRAAGSRRWG